MMIHSKYTVAIPPGATIREQLENRHMFQKEFALRMGMSEKHISRLINGKVELTPDTALRLEYVLGVPAKFWNSLEANYREKIARVEAELDNEQELELVSKFPYTKLVKVGWLPEAKSRQEKLVNLRNFFEVAKLGIIDNLRMPGIAYRKNGSNEKSDYTLAAWAQKAKMEARHIETSDISIEKLKDEIDVLRDFTLLDPQKFFGQLRGLLAECGVALVCLPHIAGSFLHGAAFHDGKKIVLGLTVRGKDADIFWFSFFHELFHIIDGHIYNCRKTTEEEETAADHFARDTLIPPAAFAEFVLHSNFSKERIVDFAHQIDIAPGIILGRLQKENYVNYNQFRDLKVQYELIS